MKENLKIKKACGFYISDMHFVTMMLPYINKKIEQDTKIFTMFEKNQSKNIELIMKKINLSENIKNKILEMNWEKTNLTKVDILNEKLDNLLKQPENIEILISGSEKYINKIEKIIEKYFLKNNKINRKITIINCYEVTDFNNNIQEILDKHDLIINTSGEHAKEEIYRGYKKNEKVI